MAGENAHIRVWKITTPDDDVIGGAVATGTPLYDLPCRITPVKPDEMLLQQGIESAYSYTCMVRKITLLVEDQYEVEITSPKNHPEVNSRFHVTNVQRTSFHPNDSRAFTKLFLRKRKYAHRK